MKSVGTIDRIAGSGNKEAAGHADALAIREFAFFLLPLRAFFDCFNTLFHTQRRHVESVAGGVTSLHHIHHPQFDRVDFELFSDDIELLLKTGPGRNPAVAALGPAGGLVGVDAGTVVFHVW